MKEKIKQYIGAALGTGLLIAFFVAILSCIALFGGAIMKIFGFEYHSVGSIILFFVIVGALSFPIEILAKGLPKALLSMGKVDLNMARVLFCLLDTITAVVAMTMVDYVMDSVSATSLSIWIVAFVMSLISVKDIKQSGD